MVKIFIQSVNKGGKYHAEEFAPTLMPIGVMKFDSRFNVSSFVLLSSASANDC